MQIKTIDGLNIVKEKYLPLVKQRLGHSNGIGISQVMVCSGTSCISGESQDVRRELERELERRNLQNSVQVIKTGCFGFCQHGPIVMIHPGEHFYCRVKPQDVKKLVETHLVNSQVVEELQYQNKSEKVNNIEDIHFFKAQKRIVLQNCGVIDPEEIGEYIARDGYYALADIILNKKPAEIIDRIKNPGCGVGRPAPNRQEVGNGGHARSQSQIYFVQRG